MTSGEQATAVWLSDLLEQVRDRAEQTDDHDVEAGLERLNATIARARSAGRAGGPARVGFGRNPRTELVGRGDEMTTLSSAVTATAAGVGSCAVVTGAPGIGKTRLLGTSMDAARAMGLAVAPGQAAELDRVAPLTTVVSALQRTVPVPVDLSSLRHHEGDRFWYIDRLAEALEKYAAECPLLAVIDDAQWADEFSALALRVLVPELSSAPVHWLLARRPVPAGSAGQQTVDWLIEQGFAAEMRLEPLDEEAVVQLSALVTGARPDATVIALATRCGGNPFLIEQLLGTMLAAGQVVERDGIATVVGDELPFSFLAAVEQRLRGLSAEARRLLQAGAVFARPFTVDAAAPLVGAPPSVLYGAAEEAVAAGILAERDARLVFAHDLLREAIYNNVAGPVRATMHRAAADVVRAEGRSTVEVAEHLTHTAQAGDREAVKVLRDAALGLASRAPGTAADLIVRSLDMIGEDDGDRSALVADAVGLLASAGRLEPALGLGESILHSGLDARTEATVLLGLAEALKHAGRNAASVEHARRALALPGVPDAVRARLHAIAAHALFAVVDDMPSADRAGAEAESLGRAVGEYGASVFGTTARSIVARAGGRLDDALRYARDAVEAADRVGGDAAHRHPRIWLGAALAAVDDFDTAEAVYTRGRREAEGLGTGWSYPLWHFYHASLMAAQGRLEDAAVEGDAGLRVAEQLTAHQLSVPLLALLARVAVQRNQMPLAREHIRGMQRLLGLGITAAPEDWVWALAVLRDADGSAVEVRDTMVEIFDLMPVRVLLFADDPGAAPMLVRVALAAGDRERAEWVTAVASQLARNNPGVPTLAGVAAHAVGLLHRDLDALRTAVDQLRQSPRPLVRASALEDAAGAEHAAQHRAAAVELAEQALADVTASGANRAVARLERLMRTLGMRKTAVRATGPVESSPVSGLTKAALRVARLVASGRTNRQIADELFISPHTVDSHVRTIYQRLGVNSRVELTRIMLKHDRPADA
jgi:DNA-binding CsgD family transcriptional regulator/tetratricopeptide (TPR) repeat protein